MRYKSLKIHGTSSQFAHLHTWLQALALTHPGGLYDHRNFGGCALLFPNWAKGWYDHLSYTRGGGSRRQQRAAVNWKQLKTRAVGVTCPAHPSQYSFPSPPDHRFGHVTQAPANHSIPFPLPQPPVQGRAHDTKMRQSECHPRTFPTGTGRKHLLALGSLDCWEVSLKLPAAWPLRGWRPPAKRWEPYRPKSLVFSPLQGQRQSHHLRVCSARHEVPPGTPSFWVT